MNNLAEQRTPFSTEGNTHMCAFKGCFASTQGQKVYCLEHVEHCSYAAEVAAEVARAEAEVEAIRKRGRKGVNLDGVLARETMFTVDEYPKTRRGLVAHLRNWVGKDVSIVEAICAELVASKRAKWISGRDGGRLASPEWE